MSVVLKVLGSCDGLITMTTRAAVYERRHCALVTYSNGLLVTVRPRSSFAALRSSKGYQFVWQFFPDTQRGLGSSLGGRHRGVRGGIARGQGRDRLTGQGDQQAPGLHLHREASSESQQDDQAGSVGKGGQGT